MNNCTLSGNSTLLPSPQGLGGGSYRSTLNNCSLTGNSASGDGGGSYSATLNNCTLTANSARSGGGSYLGRLNNCIVWGNAASIAPNNYLSVLFYTCTSPPALGLSNISIDPQLVDGAHIAVTSPCRGKGSTDYSTGTDIESEAWLNPPSMGCDEVWEAGITGSLSVAASALWPTVAEKGSMPLAGYITGRASGLEWSFGDGLTVTNVGYLTSHVWTNAGDYTVTFTAFNADHPDGVTTNLMIQVLPLVEPTLAAGGLSGKTFSLSFPGQPGVTYVVEQTTNLAPPVTWQTVGTVSSAGEMMQITDTKATNDARYYRVRAP